MVAPLLITGFKSLSVMHKSAIENLFYYYYYCCWGQTDKHLRRLDGNETTVRSRRQSCYNGDIVPGSTFQVSAVKLNKPAWPIYLVCISGFVRRWFVCMFKNCNLLQRIHTSPHMRAYTHTWSVLAGSDGSAFAASQNFTLPTCFFFFPASLLKSVPDESASFCTAHPNHHNAVIRIAPNVHRQQLTTSLQLYRQ